MEIWSESRRSAYLLRQDVLAPLSVDEFCWPSVFESSASQVLGLSCFKVPAKDQYLRRNSTYWDSLVRLESALPDEIAASMTQKVVQVVKCSGKPNIDGNLHDGFIPVGYDVAGLGLRSSLSNCAFSREEQLDLKRQYANELNGYHLFPEWLSANDYVQESNRMVPEHSPFFAYLVACRSQQR